MSPADRMTPTSKIGLTKQTAFRPGTRLGGTMTRASVRVQKGPKARTMRKRRPIDDADVDELVGRALRLLETAVRPTPEGRAEVVRELAFSRACEIGASPAWARTLAQKAHERVLWSSRPPRTKPCKVG